LVAAGVQRVVVAMLDPDPRNAGAGIRILRQANVEVRVGLLEEEARKDLGAYAGST
jgi:pyrimidine deaminase RibD-like protein